MTYFFLLVLTYTFDGTTYVSQIAFRDQASCANAMDPIFETVLAHYPDSMAQCTATDTPSGSVIRPRSRPTK